MKKISYISFLLGGAIFFTSCKTTFNTAHRSTIEEGGSTCDKVQFYNSKYILLRRALSSSEVSTAKGRVQIVNGKAYEYFDIPAKTKGISPKEATDTGEAYLAISFFDDPGDYLFFASNGTGQYYGLAQVSKKGKEFTSKGLLNCESKSVDFLLQHLPNSASKGKQSCGTTALGEDKIVEVLSGGDAILLFDNNLKNFETATRKKAAGRTVE